MDLLNIFTGDGLKEQDLQLFLTSVRHDGSLFDLTRWINKKLPPLKLLVESMRLIDACTLPYNHSIPCIPAFHSTIPFCRIKTPPLMSVHDTILSMPELSHNHTGCFDIVGCPLFAILLTSHKIGQIAIATFTVETSLSQIARRIMKAMNLFLAVIMTGLVCVPLSKGTGIVYYVRPTEQISSCNKSSQCPSGQVCQTMNYFAENSLHDLYRH